MTKSLIFILAFVVTALAQQPVTPGQPGNQAARQQPAMRPIPPVGVEVPAPDRTELENGLKRLKVAMDKLNQHPLWPDVAIYHEAVRYALQYNEFFKLEEVFKAKLLLQHGEERARQLSEGKAPWTTATGLVVRGYVSKIDKSVQPYGLVIPASFTPNAPQRWRLDTWFHGRGETLSEVNFLSERETRMGEFTPRDTFVVHLYGRFCNANKFAGEVDLFETLDKVKQQYRIDENRILVRGFSMGGASTWQFGTHYPGLWAAIAPGAGFSESAQFLKLKLDGPDAPPWWEQKLFHLYDATDYAVNLFNTPVVAYNGEIDGQKQAADMMEKAMDAEGLRLRRVVGPKTGHSYHPDSKVELDRILDAIAERGRDPYPRKLQFTTWTLAYNQMKWATIDALGQHWERARLNAELVGDNGINVETANVAAFTFEMGPGGCALDGTRKPVVTIDGQKLTVAGLMSDRSWRVHFRKTGNQWAVADAPVVAGLHKVHGLQGPVDDAFLDSFVFVTPTAPPLAPGVAKWVEREQQRAITEWRRHFRGDAQVRKDAEITDADIAASNLILWGDPGSNKILARIADKLPLKWTAESIVVGSNRYAASTHAPILIFPNPLNPKKYIVLNSGFTFREFDYLNNARQIPKLPDFAVVDTTTPPDWRYPGKLVLAGFFKEDWTL
ncbi:MAG: prolyl oligopeptidase family serine peptidase [Acidobacteria bacterium]|nr:prolyl oligopeptidase family serine peptidase [Acidobacteriota bacterium]MBI3427437.1 prolyl oligopeptidase family serine peptidase [Acidobacteriota bacterium]